MFLETLFKFDISPEVVIVVLSAFTALALDWVPGLSEWYEKLTSVAKRGIALGLGVLIGVGAFVGDCLGYFDTNLVCDVASIATLLYGVFLAVGSMYAIHRATRPRPQ